VRPAAANRVVTARRPNQVVHVDLTTVPTSLGFWVPWLPRALPQIWPFCWWVAVVADHFSRRVLGTATFRKEPTSAEVRSFLDRVFAKAGVRPRDLISDKGVQFTAEGFAHWCRRNKIRHRFGAVGKYGSIAVIERLMKTLKNECTRRLALVSFRRSEFVRELSLWAAWYNGNRPHETLRAKTPDEVYFGKRPACRAPRFEPRTQWPRRSPCAAPHVLIRGRPGVSVELVVTFQDGRKHLPLVELRRAA
jgi:putative transposase